METDAAIVRRAIEGDERAMRLLWNQHAPHVDAIVRRLAGDSDLAEDIAQEVWIQIFRALPSWRGDAKFSTWVHRVAINRALNALRRTKRLASIETGIEEDSAVVEQESERSMLAQTIEEATRKLSPGRADGVPAARRGRLYARGNRGGAGHHVRWLEVATLQGACEAASAARTAR